MTTVARLVLADAVRADTGTTNDRLVEAFATVPRERFLPPGPWHLRDWPWVDVRCGDGTTDLPTNIDVIVIHAGASHLRPEWLAAMAPGARLLVPLTVAMPAMGATLGKGITFVITRDTNSWRAKALSYVAIYSMVSARDEAMAALLGQAMQRGGWDQVTRLRTDPHTADETCWCHWHSVCLQTG